MYCTLPEVTHLFLLGNSGSSFIPKCFDCDHVISCDHVIVYIMCLFLMHVLYELGSVYLLCAFRTLHVLQIVLNMYHMVWSPTQW